MSSIQEVHYFTGFQGLAGAAYDDANPDGGLRPFKIGKVDPKMFRLTICTIALEDGGVLVGSSFSGYREAFRDAQGKI